MPFAGFEGKEAKEVTASFPSAFADRTVKRLRYRAIIKRLRKAPHKKLIFFITLPLLDKTKGVTPCV